MIEPGTKNGEILRQPPFEIRGLRVLDHRQAADAGPHAHAHALLVAGIAVQARVLDRLHRGDQAVVHERVVAAGFLGGQVLADVEFLHLAGDVHRKVRRVEARDPGDAGTARDDVRPRRRQPDADRRDDSQPGNDDAAVGHVRSVNDEVPGVRERVAARARAAPARSRISVALSCDEPVAMLRATRRRPRRPAYFLRWPPT